MTTHTRLSVGGATVFPFPSVHLGLVPLCSSLILHLSSLLFPLHAQGQHGPDTPTTAPATATVQLPKAAPSAVGAPDNVELAGLSADELHQRADRLFGKREYMACAQVCHEISRRYPGSDHSHRAELLVARMYEALDDTAKAVSAYEHLIRTSPDSPLAAEARARLPLVLYGAGRKQEAIELKKTNAEAAKDDYTRANLYYNAAELARGVNDVEATACFNKIIREFPDTPFASMAKKGLQKMADDLLKSLNALEE